MSTIYENINTFNDEIYKSDLREKILNPMIVQHNHHSVDLNNHEARIDALEEGGVGGGVSNFKDLDDVPDYVANKFLKVDLSGDLEWASVAGDVVGGPTTFIEMTDTPATYENSAGKFVQVSEEGGSLVFVDAPAGGGGDSYDDTVLSGRVDAVETALEGVYTKEEADTKFALKGATGGGYDDTVLTARVADVESDVESLTTSMATESGRIDGLIEVDGSLNTMITDHATRIEALEGSEGGSITSINNSQVKFDWSVSNLPNSSGGGQDKSISASDVLANSFFISATASASATLTVNMPEITESTSPTSVQTAGGRLWYFANTGGSTMLIVPNGSQKVYNGSGATGSTSVTIPAGYFAQIMAVSNPAGGFNHWVVVAYGNTLIA